MTFEKPRRRQARLLRLVHRQEHESLPFFDIKPYLPAGAQADFVEKGGFLMNPHVINEFAHKVIRKKEELVIFNCLLRYSLGFNRSFCRASLTFISRWTGLDSANVRRGLRGLLDAKLVVIAREGTATQSTVYEIPIVLGYLKWVASRGTVNTTGGHMTSGDLLDPGQNDLWSNGLLSNGQYPSCQLDSGTTVNVTTKKENSKENEEIHSQQRSPEALELELYLQGVKPVRKQESERFFFQSLRKDFNEGDVLLGLRYLQAHGVLGTKEPCHSPMSYLARAGEDVILLAKAETSKRLAREHADREATDRARREKEHETAEHAAQLVALEQFQQTFSSSEQDLRMEAFLNANYPGRTFQFPRAVVLGFVARQWWDELNGHKESKPLETMEDRQ